MAFTLEKKTVIRKFLETINALKKREDLSMPPEAIKLAEEMNRFFLNEYAKLLKTDVWSDWYCPKCNGVPPAIKEVSVKTEIFGIEEWDRVEVCAIHECTVWRKRYKTKRFEEAERRFEELKRKLEEIVEPIHKKRIEALEEQGFKIDSDLDFFYLYYKGQRVKGLTMDDIEVIGRAFRDFVYGYW